MRSETASNTKVLTQPVDTDKFNAEVDNSSRANGASGISDPAGKPGRGNEHGASHNAENTSVPVEVSPVEVSPVEVSPVEVSNENLEIVDAPRERLAIFAHGSPFAWLVLFVSLVLSGVAWYCSNRYIQHRVQDRFSFRVAQISENIKERMLTYEQVLRGGLGLFMASDKVDRDEWHEYVKTLEIDSRYPGIQGIGVSIPIARERLEAHVRSIREEGFLSYDVRPAGTRDTYHAIIYLEPFDWRNQRAFGFDMYSNPIRRKAMDRAIDTGMPSISGMVTLVQETDKDVQKGFLMYFPMYRPHLPHTTPKERRAAFVGFVYAPFRIANLMQGILGEGVDDVRFSIYDAGIVSPDGLLYASDGSPVQPAFGSKQNLNSTVSIVLAGHSWSLVAEARPGFATTGENIQSTIVGFCALLVDIVLFLIINAIARQRRHAIAATHQLQRNQNRLNAILNASSDAIVSVEIDGTIVHWNRGATQIFGYTAAEVTGRNSTMLMTEESAGSLQQMLSDPAPPNSGHTTQLSGLRSDGDTVPLDVAVTSWQTDGHEFRALTMHDVTERCRLEKDQAVYTAQLERTNRELDEFTRAASHDLKAPLRAVDNLASWIQNDAADVLPEKSREHLSRMRNRISRLERLLDDLLEFSRAGRMMGEISVIDIRDLTDEVVGLLAPPPGFNVTFRGDCQLFRSYRTPLRQVMQNLISNAIKHHHSTSGEILVTCAYTTYAVLITVCDDGPGIAPKHHDRVFGMFQTLRSRDEMEGSGVGLALVKKVVIAQGGTIVLDSDEGEGTVISFTWPLNEPTLEPAKAIRTISNSLTDAAA